jgi:hypothetical protein
VRWRSRNSRISIRWRSRLSPCERLSFCETHNLSIRSRYSCGRSRQMFCRHDRGNQITVSYMSLMIVILLVSPSHKLAQYLYHSNVKTLLFGGQSNNKEIPEPLALGFHSSASNRQGRALACQISPLLRHPQALHIISFRGAVSRQRTAA